MMRRRWGDADDDEDALPESTTVGPNDRGIITKTEYYKNPKGVAMKKITKIQLVKVQTKVYEVSSTTWLPCPPCALGSLTQTHHRGTIVIIKAWRQRVRKHVSLDRKPLSRLLLRGSSGQSSAWQGHKATGVSQCNQ